MSQSISPSTSNCDEANNTGYERAAYLGAARLFTQQPAHVVLTVPRQQVIGFGPPGRQVGPLLKLRMKA